MTQPHSWNRLVPRILFLSLLAACGDSGGSAADAITTATAETTTTAVVPATTTLAPTVETTTTTAVITTTTTAAPVLMAEGSGNGNALVEFSIEKTATAVTFTHEGSEAFLVRDLDVSLEPMGVLIDTIGHYEGTRPLQWEAASGGFEITADGSWTYAVFNIDYARHEDCPFEGNGDDVVLINDFKGGNLKEPADRPVAIEFNGDTKFDIWIYGFGTPQHAVDANGPYQGIIPVADGMIIWEFVANGGAWTIDCGSS